jgi:sugar (pentulose or hexulose) kinase
VSTALLLGLDVGTTAVKAAVIDAAGREVAHGRARTPWRDVPTGAEIDPGDLLASAIRAAGEALEDAPAGEIAGIGVASMAETGVLLDRSGRPAVPSIAWHDERGGAEADAIRRDLGAEEFSRHTGLPVSELCTLAKYRWMRDHLPGTERGVRWLNVAEWIVRGLGGEEAAELSLASRTGCYDLQAKRPWDAALAWADAPDGLMPEAVPAGTTMGRASADTLPRSRGAVLTVGGHDHLAAAVGAGAAGEGDVLDSCGTAEAFVRASAPVDPDRVLDAVAQGITVGWHAVEGRQVLLGAVWSGSALSRVLALLGVPVEERHELEAAALRATPGDIRVLGLDDSHLTLTGIERHASPAAAYRAALEAVGEAGANVLRNMQAVTGSQARRLVVTGGWAAGEAAQAVKQAHLGPYEHDAAISTGARGAALAAGRAAGMWNIDDAPRAVGAPQEVTR